MAQNQAKAQSTPEVVAADKLYMENTLLRIAGGLFCHDSRRAPTRTELIKLDNSAADKRITIEPHPNYGQPGPLAHKLFVALIKKHSNYGQPIQDNVSFTVRELARMTGREWAGSTTGKQLKRALHEIQSTFITTSFQAGKPVRYFESRFTIFGETTVEIGDQDNLDDIRGVSVKIATPIIASLRDKHFTCLNHRTMMQLGSVGQAFYMRLFFHFANLYDEKQGKRISVTKRYDAICDEWLGGLTKLKHKSKIEREQLGAHLLQLKKLGFLASYQIDKTGDNSGFKITFRPGATFFTDYDRYYRNRQQGELQWQYQDDQASMAEPLQAARLFLEKKSGQPASPLAYVPSADVTAAREIITHIGAQNIAEFISYGLSEARKTRFDVQRLGGLKQYLDSFQKSKIAAQQDSKKEEQDAAQERQAMREEAYAHYQRQALRQLFNALSPAEQAEIDAEATDSQPRALRSNGPLAPRLLEIARGTILTKRYPDHLKHIDDWLAEA